jgi:hypothetical protein
MMSALFKEHNFLKLEAITWWHKTWNKEARWNEFKWELNAIMDVVFLLTLADEVAYH